MGCTHSNDAVATRRPSVTGDSVPDRRHTARNAVSHQPSHGVEWQSFDPVLYRGNAGLDDDAALAHAIERSLASAEAERLLHSTESHSTTATATVHIHSLSISPNAAAAAPPPPPHTPSSLVEGQTTRDTHPFSRAELKQMPQIRWMPPGAPVAASDDADEWSYTCPLCFEAYDEQTELMLLPCFHRFHWHCTADWLQRRPECPLCKSSARHTGSAILGA